MAQFGVRLPVFISSPSDVPEEREVVERVVHHLAARAHRNNLLLSCYRFEHRAQPSLERPMDQSNRDLRDSELVIGILGNGMGSPATPGGVETGTMEELRIADEQVRRGATDDVFLYYRAIDDAGTPVPGVAEYINRKRAEKRQWISSYRGRVDFEIRLERDLEKWIDDWKEIPTICLRALSSSNLAWEKKTVVLGENRILALLGPVSVAELPADLVEWGLASVRIYQGHQLHAFPGILAGFIQRYGVHDVEEVFHLLCAIGLRHGLGVGEIGMVTGRQYPNPVHQFLSVLINGAHNTDQIFGTLRNWLARRSGPNLISPVARNFAAYVLGMAEDFGAEDLLLDALRNDRGVGVRTYCITSLGKLRSRRHLAALKQEYFASDDAEDQTLIARAIARTVGVARFEL